MTVLLKASNKEGTGSERESPILANKCVCEAPVPLFLDDVRRMPMFFVDDILLAPVTGLVAVCRKIEGAARQELEMRGKEAMSALGDLHRRLELGQIDDQAFDQEEARLLDQIEALEKVLHPHKWPDEP
jgi:hypothetical protein